ncbi:MAG: HEPN domain-containing protein [Nitrospirae bacterium]|nr:HEPN domain-containing protein [Nitrospirota bacterium]
MTDKQSLLAYRLSQADETLSDAGKMLTEGISPRSVINRAYYAMFYGVLALFIHADINPKTSKHSGIISIFDKEFVHSGKLEVRQSKLLHRMFDARQQADYRELASPSANEAEEGVMSAREFLDAVKKVME